jgi:hypothetical protein
MGLEIRIKIPITWGVQMKKDLAGLRRTEKERNPKPA